MKNIKYYFQSEYDGSWWIEFRDDRPRYFYGCHPPKKSKFPIIKSPCVPHHGNIHRISNRRY